VYFDYYITYEEDTIEVYARTIQVFGDKKIVCEEPSCGNRQGGCRFIRDLLGPLQELSSCPFFTTNSLDARLDLKGIQYVDQELIIILKAIPPRKILSPLETIQGLN